MGYRPCSFYKVFGGICITAYYSLFEKTNDPNFYKPEKQYNHLPLKMYFATIPV